MLAKQMFKDNILFLEQVVKVFIFIFLKFFHKYIYTIILREPMEFPYVDYIFAFPHNNQIPSEMIYKPILPCKITR